jgi:hypothetical protein
VNANPHNIEQLLCAGRKQDVEKARETFHRLSHDSGQESQASYYASTLLLEPGKLLCGFLNGHNLVDFHFFQRRARVHHLIGMAAIGISNVTAKRGYFDLAAVASNENDTERMTPNCAPTAMLSEKSCITRSGVAFVETL